MMKRSNRLVRILAATVAMIGSLHAPLHAEAPALDADLIRPEVVAAVSEMDQSNVLRQSAEDALKRAHSAMKADLEIDLSQTIGKSMTLTVAINK